MSLMSQVREFLSPTPNVPLERGYWDPFGSVTFNGYAYPLGLNQTMPGVKQEHIDSSLLSVAQQAYGANAIVFACMDAHRRLFSEARFQFRRLRNGQPGDLFGTGDLGILEEPWPNGTTGDLLGRMIQYADLVGNFYGVRRGNTIAVLRPDWVSILLDVPAEDVDAQILGYEYQPGGPAGGNKPVRFLVGDVAHFAPIPNPLARYVGMSWLSPLIREIQADTAATVHKLAFFENGATPNMVVKRSDELSKESFAEWVRLMEAGHTGQANAYKTLYLTSGADATVIGANLRQLDFKNTQGAGETRIAAAAGIPPIIVGLSEGLAAATYSNYGQARRAYADLWARPTWRNAAGSLATIINVPGGAELWYDDRDISFLAEDQKDLADIGAVKASTIENLIRAGYKADSVVNAVVANDMSLLVGEHTGLFSVQLQAPGGRYMPQGEAPGQQPVAGPGTKPVVPAVPVSITGSPLGSVPAVPPKTTPGRAELLLDMLRRSYQREERWQELARQPAPILNYTASPITVNTPEVRNEIHPTAIENRIEVNPTPVEVHNTIEPTPVEIRNELTMEPTPVEIHNDVNPTPVEVTVTAPEVSITNEIPAQRPVTKTIVREAGLITEIREEPDGE